MTALATAPSSTPHRTPDAGLPAHRDSTSFEKAATQSLAVLQRALRSFLEAVPGGVRKAADLQRVFDLDSKLAGQVYKVASASNPLAGGVNVPPRISLERLLRSATRKQISAPLVGRVSEAFDQFEHMVQEQAGDRAEFESLIAAIIPEERERMLLDSREMLYNAARNIRGMATEVALSSCMFFPSKDDPEKLEIVRVDGDLGLRRIHREARILVSNSSSYATDEVLTIDGRKIVDQSSVMLEPFCSSPVPTYRVSSIEKEHAVVWYTLEGEDVGIRSAVDAVRGDYVRPSIKTRYWSPERPVLRVMKDAPIPARWQVVDVLACEGMVSLEGYRTFVYDKIPAGDLMLYPVTHPIHDDVAYKPSVRYMGDGPGAFRCAHIPRYEEMIAYICEKRGWDETRLQGFRVEIEYPVYSWQTALSLVKLPKP